MAVILILKVLTSAFGFSFTDHFPEGIYLFKVNNENPRTMLEIYIKLAFSVNDVVMVSLLLNLNRFHRLFCCSLRWLWTSKWRLGLSFMVVDIFSFMVKENGTDKISKIKRSNEYWSNIFNHYSTNSLYSFLPNKRDVTAINFLRIFHPQLCYFSHHVY